MYPLKKWLSCHAEFISASKIEILKQVQNDIILRGYKNIACFYIWVVKNSPILYQILNKR